MQNEFTPEASKIWGSYTEDVKAWLLNHIWCGRCQKISSIKDYTGEIESGLLVLRGRCERCDSDMVRITGTPKLRSLWYKFLAKRKIEHMVKTSNIYPDQPKAH